jgi:hypothetical protein
VLLMGGVFVAGRPDLRAGAQVVAVASPLLVRLGRLRTQPRQPLLPHVDVIVLAASPRYPRGGNGSSPYVYSYSIVPSILCTTS